MNEDTLINRAKTLEVIRDHGFTLRKKYGQNFLTDSHVLD